MSRVERILFLNRILLDEMPHYLKEAKAFPETLLAQRRLLRSLMNVRPPLPVRKDFLQEQDVLLQEESQEKGIISLDMLQNSATSHQSGIFLWQGDITRLAVDAIVNAANSALLGCFAPCHGCIDNAIHSAAGIQLRNACHAIMQEQGHDEPTGQAKLTPAFNLPSRYVLHTVGPIIHAKSKDGSRYEPTEEDEKLLASCYRSCLELAEKHHLSSIAFCCISTGEFHYPNRPAAHLAIRTVTKWLKESRSNMKIVFNVFKDEDANIYRELLEKD